MKTPRLLTLGVCLLTIGAASATVTLTISNPATGVLTNIANFNGTTTPLLWGILVDAGGDGFDSSASGNQVFPLANYPDGVVVPGSDDDVLFLNLALTTVTVPGPQGGNGSITSYSGLVLNSTLGVNPGDVFQIIWFDNNSGSPTAMDANDHYGVFGVAAFTLPADGSTQPYASNFIGADPVRPASIPWIFPEPSSLMLSLLGVLPLLRRRR